MEEVSRGGEVRLAKVAGFAEVAKLVRMVMAARLFWVSSLALVARQRPYVGRFAMVVGLAGQGGQDCLGGLVGPNVVVHIPPLKSSSQT